MELGPILRSLARNKVRFTLIVLEIALTLAIVTNCLGIIGDARRKLARESGFDDENLLSVETQYFAPAFKEEGYRDNQVAADLRVLAAHPRVQAATQTSFLPWQGGGSSTLLKVQGRESQGDPTFRTQIYPADAGILDTLGIELVAGKALTPDDVERDTRRLRELSKNPRPPKGQREPFSQDVMISKALADLVFPDGKALGRILEDDDGDHYPIVGVVDAFYNPYAWPIHEYVVFYGFRPASATSVHYLVRARPGQAAALVTELEEALLAANDGRNLRIRTIPAVKLAYFEGQAGVVTMVGVLMALLVFVTALGIVGMTSFAVAERTRQIGTRRALGARRADILRYFLLENWIVTSLGAAVGVGLAIGLNVFLLSLVSDAKLSLWTTGGGVLLLWAVGLGATLVPALRAARVSPVTATRSV